MCSLFQNDPAASGEFGCARAGCRACQDALIREHTGLIHAVLRRVAHAGVPYDELVQVGRVALWRAVCGFDPERGGQFSTYAWRALERALWHAVRQARQPQGYLAAPEPAHPWRHADVRAALLTAVQQLPERLQAVVMAVYGLAEQPPQSRAAVGRAWGVSRERIRQLHEQALARLRHPGLNARLYQVCGRVSRGAYQQAQRSQRAAQRERRR